VIIGPAQRPGRPIAWPAGPTARLAVDGSQDAFRDTGSPPDDKPKNGKGKFSALLSALVRLGSSVFRLLTHVLLAVGTGSLSVGRRYPRHSLAACASVLILGAIWHTQMRSGPSAHMPVVNWIAGDSSAQLAADEKHAPGAKKDGAETGPGPTAIASVESSNAAKPGGGSTILSEATRPSEKTAPAPAAAVHDDAVSSLSSLAEAPTPGHKHGPAPGRAPSTTDLEAKPKPEDAPTPASHEEATPTFLATTSPDPAPEPSAPTVPDDKAGGEPLRPAPALDAPVPPPLQGLTSSARELWEPAPLPAHTDDPSRPVPTLDRVADQNKSTLTSALGKAANADDKSQEATAPTEQKSGPNSQATPKSGPAQQANASISQPESMKIESIKIEPLNPERTKVDAGGPSRKSGAPPLPPATTEVPTPGDLRAGKTKLRVDNPPTRPKPSTYVEKNDTGGPAIPAPIPVTPPAPLDSRSLIADSKSQAPDSQSQVPASKDLGRTSSDTPLRPIEPEPRKPSARGRDLDAKHPTLEGLTSAGWVPVPNRGRVPADGAADVEAPRGDADLFGAAESSATPDVRAHAAKNVSFEFESPQLRGAQNIKQSGQRSTVGPGSASEPGSRTASGRVEPVSHVVEPNENFWTIARLYYSSGRYYRALWKANADKYPEIDKLTVNDVILVPPADDLDPAFIDAPRTRAPATLSGALRHPRVDPRNDAAEAAESSASSSLTGDTRVSTARTNRGLAVSIPVRRSSRTDLDLDLPEPQTVARRDRFNDHTGRRADRAQSGDADNDEPETRSAARPRGTGAVPSSRQVYKVRPYDSLRSIARDMLGNSKRANEILDLNRDLIDDPTQLIVGQILELPEDSRTTVRRSTSRR